MQDFKQLISELYKKTFNNNPEEIVLLEQSGSDRKYFRVWQKDKSIIATASENIFENETFFYFAEHFRLNNISVPQIIAISDDKKIYFQSDFGDVNLLDLILKEGHNELIYKLLQKALLNLINIQIDGDKNLDYNKYSNNGTFGKQAIFSDLLYFKYYFADTLKIEYNKEKLLEDFDNLSSHLANTDYRYFMFRDFQSRNIMVKEDELFFIDFQGGMKGAVQYDIASFLWQAKANLPHEWKEQLLEFYIENFEKKLQTSINRNRFKNQYNCFVLVRLLQVLGAYGFRGIFERKTHFLDSIAPALRNLLCYKNNNKLDIELPELAKLIETITSNEIQNKFSVNTAKKGNPLEVKINSFSFIKTGYPNENSEHKGGYVFDCRGILNPGRIDEYKDLNGRDKSVIYFFEQNTEMPDFLNNIFNIVDLSVNEYLRRGFQSLTVNFGCTGGQHRSVYAADKMAQHILKKFNVKVKLNHIEQKISETLIPDYQ
ncbi:MAG: phosphotransferase [Bacteroidia bacterium]|nr:phosphotransferase [Bacteroidia bacterium]